MKLNKRTLGFAIVALGYLGYYLGLIAIAQRQNPYPDLDLLTGLFCGFVILTAFLVALCSL